MARDISDTVMGTLGQERLIFDVRTLDQLVLALTHAERIHGAPKSWKVEGGGAILSRIMPDAEYGFSSFQVEQTPEETARKLWRHYHLRPSQELAAASAIKVNIPLILVIRQSNARELYIDPHCIINVEAVLATKQLEVSAISS